MSICELIAVVLVAGIFGIVATAITSIICDTLTYIEEISYVDEDDKYLDVTFIPADADPETKPNDEVPF